MYQQRTSSTKSSSSTRRSDERPDKRGYNERPAPREQKVSIPPMRYKLTKLSQAQTLTQISSVTQGFYNMSINSADWIQRDVRSREFTSFGSYPAPSKLNTLVAVMGEDSYYLKLTMKNHDMDYICYDDDKHEFHFWGEYQCCIKAMNELRYRISKIEIRMEKEKAAEKKEQWPVSNYSPIEEREKEEDNVPESPYYYMSIAKPFDWAAEEDKDVVDASYSVVAKEQMNKMGFVDGVGLGSKGTGRTEPINHIKDLGGRYSTRDCSGLGFVSEYFMSKCVIDEPAALELEPAVLVPAALVPAALVPAALVPAALVPAVLVPAALVPAALVPAALVPAVVLEKPMTEAEKYGCKCLGDSGKCCMSCWRNADA